MACLGRLLPAAVFLGGTLLAGPAGAQHASAAGALSSMPLPGGLRGALDAIRDHVPADRGQFLLEVIRAHHNTAVVTKTDPREAPLRTLLARLDDPAQAAAGGSDDTLPLPLTPAIWIDAVFDGRATPSSLAASILRSRNASLLYYGLMSLDDPTRAWLAASRELVVEIAARHAPAFAVAAPGLRLKQGALSLPGASLAEPAWEALVGRPAGEPASFVRALLTEREGRLAWFLAVVAQLTPAQQQVVLNLDAADTAARVSAVRRMYGIFEQVAGAWTPDHRAFWRPVLDPASFAMDLRTDASGRPTVIPSRRFWNAVFADREPDLDWIADRRAGDDAERASFTWLCEQVFKPDIVQQRQRYQLALFASRVVTDITRDAVEAARAFTRFPALAATLERARVTDVRVLAAAARRAARLEAIADDGRMARSLAQFQGALTLVTRAASRGSIPAGALPELVTSLAAVDVNERGDYDGALVRWFGTRLRAPAATSDAAAEPPRALDALPDGPLDRHVIHLLAGAPVVEPRFVDWEGTRYRLDFTAAEAARLVRLLGDTWRPYCSAAWTFVGVADALASPGLTRDVLRREDEAFGAAAASISVSDEDTRAKDPVSRHRGVVAAVRRAARNGDLAGAQRLAADVRLLADESLARGLLELAYAVAMGHPGNMTVLAADAANRHDFALPSSGIHHAGAWRLPVAGGDAMRGWRVTGSLLGMDVKLADYALRRLSSKPPPRRPSLNDDDRRAFIDAVVLIEAARITDAGHAAIVAAIAKGRSRFAAVQTPADVAAVADAVQLGAARRSALAWTIVHDPSRAAAFLSPAELLWLGLEGRPADVALHAWGASAEPRLGCLCLQMPDRPSGDALAGRWSTGMMAGSFPDLPLRLAELLTELRMLPQLLAPVLAAATLELVNTAISRDQDDRRGLVEFVQALRAENLEQYLALLTTEGPLVPVGESTGVRDPGPPPTEGRR